MTGQGLTARQRLHLWEHGQSMHPVDRSLALITLTTELKRDEIVQLSVGHRNGLMLQAHYQTFGDEMNCSVNCPECHEQLTLEESAERFLSFMTKNSKDALVKHKKTISCKDTDITLEFRIPNCDDLIALSKFATPETTTALLMERCILSARDKNNYLLDIADLSNDIVKAIIDEMQSLDPLAEIIFPVTCPECAHEWKPIFEPADYVWEEIKADCKKLFHDIHQIARHYGWTEDEITSMSDSKRQKYLDMMDEAAA